MSDKKPKPPKHFDENPEWTEKMFAKAKSAHQDLSLATMRNMRGPQKLETKIPVSIRLSPDVVKHFKATGPGWQSRIDAALRAALAGKGLKKRA